MRGNLRFGTAWVDTVRHQHGKVLAVERPLTTSSWRPNQDLSQAALWLDAIVDSSDDAIIGQDMGGIITAWNRAAEIMLGYSAREIVGKPIVTIFPQEQILGGDPPWPGSAGDPPIQRYATRMLRKDGAAIPVSMSVLTIRNHNRRPIGIARIARDCTERNAREHLLQNTRTRLVEAIGQREVAETTARLAIDGGRLGLMEVYPQTKTIVLDRRARAMFGFPSAAPIAEDAFLSAMHPESRATWLAARGADNRSGEFVPQFRVGGGANGRERLLTARGHRYPGAATCRYMRCVVEDVTDTRARSLDDRPGLKHDATPQANHARSRFLLAAAHDLRQPLHAITMFLAVLRSDPPPPRTKAILDNIGAAVGSLQRMLNGLVDFVRLDAGMMTARPETFFLQRTFDAIRATFEPSAHTKGLHLRVHSTEAIVTTDPVLLQNVLQNLVSNAIGYTIRGEVAVEARGTPGGIGIEVRDTGCGIPSDRLDDVFNEFVRLDPKAGSDNGMGLGLAIVRRQAAEMGATIDVRSELGVGSIFTLTVPEPRRTFQPPPEVQAEVPHRGPLMGKRVPLVDDHKMARERLVMEAEV